MLRVVFTTVHASKVQRCFLQRDPNSNPWLATAQEAWGGASRKHGKERVYAAVKRGVAQQFSCQLNAILVFPESREPRQ